MSRWKQVQKLGAPVALLLGPKLSGALLVVSGGRVHRKADQEGRSTREARSTLFVAAKFFSFWTWTRERRQEGSWL